MVKCLFILLLSHICFASVGQKADSTRKEYLAVLTLTEKFKNEKSWTEKEQAITGEHFQRLLKYKTEGIVVLAGRTAYDVNNPAMMGLVIFYAKDDASALEFMLDDPAVKNNIMLVKVHPYGIAINKCE